MKFPDVILQQHTAVLGKTGSGKTSTAKLAIEQVVADGARVCVLDPIKSDWWGLTSSADGKRAGLPFHILGGPRGHVPLHASAGKAVAEIVASGALPLSIIDMADFEPGGQAKFFVDFAPALLRKMRGVVYLVIEEAHLFAPKERSGVGAENLSIHWAKTLATAGRSKGVRLVLVTQRTQALHNALLGSCDTLIAHRLTAPADQEPVVKWLKANTSKDVLEQVASSLASMKTGEGWICSGEARIFQRVPFGRISTYDNTATPTSDSDPRDVKTAAVDTDRLRAIIGDAVEKAKADDPRELRKQIAELKRELSKGANNIPPKEQPAKTFEKSALTEKDREVLGKLSDRIEAMRAHLFEQEARLVERVRTETAKAINAATGDMLSLLTGGGAQIEEAVRRVGVERVLGKLSQITPTTQRATEQRPSPHVRREAPALPQASGSRPARVVPPSSNGNGSVGNSGLRRMLIALAQRNGLNRRQLGVRAGLSSRSGTFDTYLSKGRTSGWIAGDASRIEVTDEGIRALGHYDPLPEGRALLDHWLGELGNSGAARILQALADAYPRALTRAELGVAANLSDRSGTFDTYLSRLRTLELVQGKGELKASDELFD